VTLGAEGFPTSRLLLQNLEKTVVFFLFYLSYPEIIFIINYNQQPLPSPPLLFLAINTQHPTPNFAHFVQQLWGCAANGEWVIWVQIIDF
jgi:hypothetical protein